MTVLIATAAAAFLALVVRKLMERPSTAQQPVRIERPLRRR